MTRPGEMVPFVDLFDFSGRTAVITGAGNGIGAATAARIAEAGGQVVVVDRDAAAAHRVAGSLTSAVAVALDITSDGSAQLIVEAAHQAFGGVDILVNSAGIFPHVDTLDMTPESWDSVMSLNVRAVFGLSQACARVMTTPGGAIVNVASYAAFRPRRGMVAYSTSKGAVISMTKALSVDLGPTVRVNAVAPGPITDTAGAAAGLPADPAAAAAAVHAVGATLPVGRTGRADDVARLIMFLASDAASFITGETVVIDGGRSLV
ncbi:MAG TPA: glucose 1-dehydrogenase [Ilumatobacter sp.]|nr:glucose 1-dehydrogenase [Ilumatobacter sp.]